MLTENITENEIKKIFNNRELKEEYISKLYETKNINQRIPRTIKELNEEIINNWDYEISKNILRELFRKSDKYLHCLGCGRTIDKSINQWSELGYGELSWPFSAMNFDKHVFDINNMAITEEEKDELISKEVIMFRRIKDINAKRNDYIEFLIFENNENVIPTFNNNRGVDFYINGVPYDQKVSKSVGKAFIKENGDNYREIAIANPQLVAKSLYEHQDEDRFGDEPRLFVVYLDNDVSADSTKEIIVNTDFGDSINVEFDYLHSKTNWIHHQTNCFIILLHN